MPAVWTASMDEPMAGDPNADDVRQLSGDRRTSMGDHRVIRSEDLMRGEREVIILHKDQRYRLVVTRNGKLILQK